jgi:hypothetical protein
LIATIFYIVLRYNTMAWLIIYSEIISIHHFKWFVLIISQIGSPCCLGLVSNHNRPTYVSHTTGITDTCHYSWFWLKWYLTNIFHLGNPSNLGLLTIWDYKHLLTCPISHFKLSSFIFELYSLLLGNLKKIL